MSDKTTIIFSDKHLKVIEIALEAYSRAKMGQFKYWFDETFGNWKYSWDCGSDIERFIRLRTLEEFLEKEYGEIEVVNRRVNHFDKLNGDINPLHFLNHYESFLNSFPSTDHEPFPRHSNASWGILQSEKVGDGQIAYEIYATLRQYTSVKQNGGLFDHYTSTRDPLNYSGLELPEIKDFVKHKDYYFNKTESKKLHKFCEKNNWVKAWEYVNKKLIPKYKIPSGESLKIQWGENYCNKTKYSWPKEDSYYLRVFKPRKEEKLTGQGSINTGNLTK